MYSSNLAQSWPPSASPTSLDHTLQVCTLMASKGISRNSLDHCLQVNLHTSTIPAFMFALSWPSSAHLQSHMITAEKFICSRPPSASPNLVDHSLQVHVQTCMIRASEFAQSRPPNSHNHGLPVSLQSCLITASESISDDTGSQSHKTVELVGTRPIIHTQLHLTQHPKRMLEKERFWLDEPRNRVSGNEGIPGHDEPPKLHRSVKVWQECMRKHTNWVDL